jgi:anti-anti-sigma regulatory factor
MAEKPTATPTRVVIAAAPYLSAESGERLEQEFLAALEGGADAFIIDFARTEIVNSIGISILIGVIEKGRERGASIGFTNLSRVNREIFTIMGLLRFAPQVEMA